MASSHGKFVNAVKVVGSIVLILGIAIFLFGYFVSEYSAPTGIGIGTIMGAVFIFLIGMFFAASEEMLEKRYKGVKVTPLKQK
ncbi:hypothetical protein [Bacillus sp. T33-2]|uniref:hypothetical protein n=1 Tax=Bacillus sp. T33-2 TaxID=2054168 RepID=UPI000C767725|nr:hypothetical protein [Bacillus sp. T33-2]PLR95090.1 hypothetical protein CVD19_15655 [Bacillus sp. T33-2]